MASTPTPRLAALAGGRFADVARRAVVGRGGGGVPYNIAITLYELPADPAARAAANAAFHDGKRTSTRLPPALRVRPRVR